MHWVWLCVNEVGVVNGLLCGHPETITVEVVYDVGGAHWFVLGFIGGQCLRGRCTSTLLLILLGGAAFLGPVALFATIVAFAPAALTLPIFGSCGG